MSTEEPKTENGVRSDAKAEPASAGAPSPDLDAAVAWPPPEAAPAGGNAGEAKPADAAAPDSAKAAGGSEAGPGDSGVMTAPEPAAKPAREAKPDDAQRDGAEMPAATPQEEMGLSNSTLHWLEDGDQAVPSRLTEPGTMPSYDPRAPVAGRRRAVLVVGGAGLLALIVAGYFYTQAESRRATQAPAPAAVEPARDLTTRAETALAANRQDEALELAHLALVADPRFADAHFVVASVQQARNQFAAARDEYRKYLELAPLGTHAAAARTALNTMPP
jgi:tetratricopeptide (TPR) repeat protein